MILAPEKLCLDNILTWLRWTGLVYLAEPVRVCQDRVFWAREPVLEAHVRLLVERGVLLSAPSKYKGPDVVEGWREDVGSCSAQVILRTSEIEIDFDHFNPTRDVVGLIGHAGEVIQNKIGKRLTDPARVAKMLKKRGIYAV